LFIFFLAIQVIEDSGRILKKIFISSLSLAFLFGVLQILGIFVFRFGGFASRAFYSVGSLNSLGFLAAMSLALFSISILKGKPESGEIEGRGFAKIIPAIMGYVGLVAALFIIVLINWWPVWTVAFVSLMASVAFVSAGNTQLLQTRRMRLFTMPMAVIVIGVFLMLVNFNWTSLKSKLPVEIAPTQKTSWKIALSSIKDRPLGYGQENFVIAYDQKKPASIANSAFYQFRFLDGSSEAINMVVEAGILGLLALVALVFFVVREVVQMVRSGFSGRSESAAIWAAVMGMTIALFLYPFNLTMMLTLFVLLAMGVVSGGNLRERIINLESDARFSFAGSIAFIVGLVLIMVAGYFMINKYIANVYIAKAQKSEDMNKAIEYFVKSTNADGGEARTYRLLSQTVLSQLADDLKNGPRSGESREVYNDRIQNQLASAVNIGIMATNVNPADSQNWLNRGLVYENLLTLVSGADQAAISTYKESLARNPADPTTYLRIGNVYLGVADVIQRAVNSGAAGQDVSAARKQIEDNLIKAEENFKEAVSLYNNYGQALFNLAAVYERQNKLGESIKQFEKLRVGNPQDPSIAFQIGLLYYRNNQKNNAFDAWRQAVTIFPNYSNARWYLSLVYEERGDMENAIKELEQIEKFNPDNQMVVEKLAKLRSGQRTIPPGKVLEQQPLNQ